MNAFHAPVVKVHDIEHELKRRWPSLDQPSLDKGDEFMRNWIRYAKILRFPEHYSFLDAQGSFGWENKQACFKYFWCSMQSVSHFACKNHHGSLSKGAMALYA